MFNKKLILNKSANSGSVRPLSEEERKALKQTLLEITGDVESVCRKNDMKLFIVGGSLLGAVRHGGFIPWDDDVDFGLVREDYTKMIKIFDRELGTKYYLRCPNSDYPNGNRFMQIFKKDTVLETAEGNTPLQPNCVSIDIFPYDAAPDFILHRIIKGIWCNSMMVIASSVTSHCYPNDECERMMKKSLGGAVLYYAESIIGKLFSWKSPAEWFDKVDKAIRYNKETHYITSATGRTHYFGETYKKNVFFPLKKMKFENLMLYAPASPDIYLKRMYGEKYMIPPDESKRESHFIKKLEL